MKQAASENCNNRERKLNYQGSFKREMGGATFQLQIITEHSGSWTGEITVDSPVTEALTGRDQRRMVPR